MAGFSLKKEPGKEYDDSMRNRAAQSAVIYYLVSGYVLFMLYKVIAAKIGGDNTVSTPVLIVIAAVLAGGAIYVIWYATRQLFKRFAESEIKPEEKNEEV